MESSTKNEQIAEVDNLKKQTGKILLKVHSVFPFQLFPDTIIVDHNKIDIIYKHFFWTKSIFTVLHQDLTTISVSTGPIFATVNFEVRGYEQNPEPVRHLFIKDAIKLRELVIGINTATKKQLDMDKIPQSVTSTDMRKVGRVNEDIQAII